jgi:hypothetical protein
MSTERQALSKGMVVAVSLRRFGTLLQHVGIVTDWDWQGQAWVISNSLARRGVVEEPLADFAAEQPVKILGYFGTLTPEAVVQRARSRRGDQWKLFSWNCEHFVRWAHGIEPASPQLTAGVAVMGTIALIAFAAFGPGTASG